MSAVRANMRLYLRAQKCLCAVFLQRSRNGGKIYAITVLITLLKCLYPLAGALGAIGTGRVAALGRAGAHTALLLIYARFSRYFATTRARVLAKMAVAEQAVEPAGGEHAFIYCVRRFHFLTFWPLSPGSWLQRGKHPSTMPASA